MELQGKVIAVLPERSGVSARGEWKSQDYVIETHDQYPKKCCFRVFGEEKINQFNIQLGEEMTVSFDIDSHEYQGRWFNDVRAWAVNRNVQVPGAAPAAPVADAAPAAAPAAESPFPPQQPAAEGSADDLPL